MIIKEIKAKRVITKTGIPDVDYVINPYVGCEHGCKYCYATFMKRFTGHKERWGAFVDVKVNALETMKNLEKYRGKSILLSSVTDPYQPLEKKYKLTRQILKKLIPIQPSISILTKSPLVIRDIDLLKEFNNCTVGLSLSIMNEKDREKFEPGAPSIKERIHALKELKKQGITNYAFIAPIHTLNDWKSIVEQTKSFVDEYWFDKLHYKDSKLDFDEIEKEIRSFCKRHKIKNRIIFNVMRS